MATTRVAAVGSLVALCSSAFADTPDFRARIAELGAEPVASTPAEAKAFVKEEAAKWQRVIAQTGVRVD